VIYFFFLAAFFFVAFFFAAFFFAMKNHLLDGDMVVARPEVASLRP
jgi:hypothetical protein